MSAEASTPVPDDVTALRAAAKVMLKWARRLCWWATLLYAVLIVLLWLMIFWRAEKNVLTAFCNFLPLLTFFLPLGILASLSLVLLSWRSLAVQVGVVLLGVWWFGGYELVGSTHSETSERALKVMTYNWGQSAGTSLKPFIAANKPDVIGIEDAGRRGPNYAKDPGYSAWPHVFQEAEFVLLSRYPVIERSTITIGGQGRTDLEQIALAGRFVVDWKGRSIVIYLVHMPTPRDLIEWYSKRGTFLHGLFPFSAKHELYQQAWENRITLARQLKEHVSQETLPVVLMGDCNTPPRGIVYRNLADKMKDCHMESGQGFGFTFPGTTHNPLALFGPWMRIDYVFAGKDWNVINFATEEGRRSQHQAAVATLTLNH